MSSARLKIAYASDDNYAHYMGISILSLLKSNLSAESIDVFVLDSGIEDESRKKLQKIADDYKRNIIFIPIIEYIGKLDLHFGVRRISAAPMPTCFLRRFFPRDCDTIIRDALSEMLDTDMGDNVFANVYSFTNKMIKRMYFLDDYYSQEEIVSARTNPAIIHYTTGLLGRPWEENCQHPLKDKYTEASNMSPWCGLPLKKDSAKRSVRLTAFMRRIMPDWLFAEVYRLLSGLTHLKE